MALLEWTAGDRLRHANFAGYCYVADKSRNLRQPGCRLAFYTSKYDIAGIQLAQGETLLFYTDGVTEARNNQGVEYGCERLARLAGERRDLIPEELVHACLSDLSTFTSAPPVWMT